MLEIALLNQIMNLPGAKQGTTEIFRASGTFQAKKTGLHFVSLQGSGAGGHPLSGGSSGAAVLRFPIFLQANDQVPITIPAGGAGMVYPSLISSAGIVPLAPDGNGGLYFFDGARVRGANGGVLTTLATANATFTPGLGIARLKTPSGYAWCANASSISYVVPATGAITSVATSPSTSLTVFAAQASSGVLYGVGASKVYTVQPNGTTR